MRHPRVAVQLDHVGPAEFGLADSELDDICVFWRHRSADTVSRRIVTTGDYGASHDYVQRLLRFLRAGSHHQSLQSQLLALRESGAVTSLVLGDHCVGLMRPHILNAPAPSQPLPRRLSSALSATRLSPSLTPPSSRRRARQR